MGNGERGKGMGEGGGVPHGPLFLLSLELYFPKKVRLGVIPHSAVCAPDFVFMPFNYFIKIIRYDAVIIWAIVNDANNCLFYRGCP